MALDFGHFLDTLPALAWIALPDGRLDHVNRRLREYSGISLDEADAWEWRALVHPDDLAGLLERWRSIRASGKAGEIEARMRRSDGQYRRFRIQCGPMSDEAEQPPKWCGVATDIEDALRAEETLRQRELDLQLVVDSIPMPVAVTSPSGEVEGLNQPTLDYFGKTFEELKGWKASDVVHPDDLERTIGAQFDAHQHGRSYHVESRHRRADGVYRWHSVHGLPLRDQEGQILRWFHLLIDIDDRKRAEEALRESELKARAVVDGIPGLVAILTPDGKTDVVNQQMAEYHGLTPEELRKWATNRTIHDDDLPKVTEIFNRAIASNTPYEIEYRLRRFDGAFRWFYSRGVPLRDDSGRISCWYALQTDIDDRKRAEQALSASERNLQLTIDTIPALAWSARPDGTAEFLSNHYLNYTGMSAKQGEDWGWTSAVHPDDVTALASVWQSVRVSGQSGEAEARLQRFDGLYRWFLFRVSPLRNDDGQIVKWYGINTDIEDRKRSEEGFRAIVETTPECVKVVARDGTVLRTNEAGAAMAGAQAVDALIGRRFFDFVAPEHRETYQAFHDRVCAGQRGVMEFDMIDALGTRRHVETHAAPLHNSDGSIAQLAVTREVTERKRVEETLGKLRSELSQVTRIMSLSALTASIAHEVNQPLAGIVTNAGTCLRMLAADPPDVEGARETARRTIRDGKRAADVIARLRALFSNRAVTFEPVDLNDAAREVIALSSSDLQRNRVELRTTLADGLPPIVGDRVQLQQVIMNLLRNGSDAMSAVNDRPRLLRVSTAHDQDGQVRLSVRDAGIGFGTEAIDRLFQAFYTTKSDGMGIGLSVSRSIIERHNGHLWAEPNDGHGATFSFSIPCRPEDARNVVAIGAADDDSTREAKRLS